MNLKYDYSQGFVPRYENYDNQDAPEIPCEWCGEPHYQNNPDRLCPHCENEQAQQNKCSLLGIICPYNFCDCRANHCSVYFFNHLQTA